MKSLSPPPSLAGFVELRRKLLTAELETATLVGRTQDVGAIKAELRFLDHQRVDALMVRVSNGRLVDGAPTHLAANFESQVNAVRRRMVELEADVTQWRAARTSRRTR